jgi:hypothetical protein
MVSSDRLLVDLKAHHRVTRELPMVVTRTRHHPQCFLLILEIDLVPLSQQHIIRCRKSLWEAPYNLQAWVDNMLTLSYTHLSSLGHSSKFYFWSPTKANSSLPNCIYRSSNLNRTFHIVSFHLIFLLGVPEVSFFSIYFLAHLLRIIGINKQRLGRENQEKKSDLQPSFIDPVQVRHVLEVAGK